MSVPLEFRVGNHIEEVITYQTKEMKKSPTAIFFIICCCCLILLFSVPHLLPMAGITIPEQCNNLSAATISIIITAVVTGLLLQCQSNTDEQREKNAKVYEQKLNVCLDFFKELCNIVEDGKITAEEANHLKFTFSYVAIHLSETSMVTISKHLSTIAQNCGQPESLQGKKPLNLAEELLSIAHTIRCEIYPKEAKAQQAMGEIVANLNKLDEQVENKLKLQEINCEHVDANYIRLLEEVKKRIRELDSSCDAELAPGPSIRITKKYAHCYACINMGHDKQGRHFFQCQVKAHGDKENVQNMYLHLHKRLGGRVGNDIGWWCEMPKDKAPVEEKLTSAHGYETIKQYAVATLQDIVIKLQEISEYNEILDELKGCELAQNWKWQPLRNNQACLFCKKWGLSCEFTIIDKENFSDLILIRESAYDIAWEDRYKAVKSDELVLQTELNKGALVEELRNLNSHFQIISGREKIDKLTQSTRIETRKIARRFGLDKWFANAK